MKTVTRSNGDNQTFDWDGVGNRTNLLRAGANQPYTRDTASNRLAGVGGMSEWSMMTGPHNWRFAYPAFLAVMIAVGAASYWGLKWLERRATAQDRNV